MKTTTTTSKMMLALLLAVSATPAPSAGQTGWAMSFGKALMRPVASGLAQTRSWLSSSMGMNSRQPRGARSEGGDEDEETQDRGDGESGKYDAMCLVPRAAKLSEPPELRFFPSGEHSSKSLGCHEPSEANQLRLADDPADYADWVERRLVAGGRFVVGATTWVLIHGFLADWRSDNWMCRMKDLIHNNSRANVFILDWSGGSKPMLPIDYGQAVANTRLVARRLANFLRPLLAEQDTELHLVGHSLGAHISGFVGYSLGPNQVARITALDPAGPCFRVPALVGSLPLIASRQAQESDQDQEQDQRQPYRRLSAASARRVLALHSDTPLFGLLDTCARTDVYVNGGLRQPACALEPAPTCSHSYAHDLLDSWPQQPGDCRPVAYACPSWAAFQRGACASCRRPHGSCQDLSLNSDVSSPPQHNEHNATGERHFIRFGASEPHCLYHYQVLVALRPSDLKAPASFYLQLPMGAGGTSRLLEVSNQQVVGVPHQREASHRHYSALLTFDSVPPGAECRTGAHPGSWPLCEPLHARQLRGAKLWTTSASTAQLEQVEWVRLNYMSSAEETERRRRSIVLAPDGVEAEADEEDAGGWRSPLSGLVSGLAMKAESVALSEQVDCRIESGGGGSDAQCNLIGRQLGRALRLRPKNSLVV